MNEQDLKKIKENTRKGSTIDVILKKTPKFSTRIYVLDIDTDKGIVLGSTKRNLNHNNIFEANINNIESINIICKF